jgi:hypothetical protein
MISEAGVAARVERLRELSIGLAKEGVMIRQGQDPLLYLERQAYLAAIRDAIAGMESARVVLARVQQRLADAASVQPSHIISGNEDGSGNSEQAA